MMASGLGKKSLGFLKFKLGTKGHDLCGGADRRDHLDGSGSGLLVAEQ